MNKIFKHCRKLCEVAFDISDSMDLHLSIVATDLAGHPIVIMRGDRTSFATLEAARRKAVTASTFQMSTHALADLFVGDPMVGLAVHAAGEMLVVPGGFPIIFGDGCVGGLGIAGGHYLEDNVVGEKTLTKVAVDTKARKST
jgi:glc operon protein GlcG